MQSSEKASSAAVAAVARTILQGAGVQTRTTKVLLPGFAVPQLLTTKPKSAFTLVRNECEWEEVNERRQYNQN